ncbi:HpcH/HpaI aldolase/citrate lyase family protein [Jatrophihabitans sp. YIM 134969]
MRHFDHLTATERSRLFFREPEQFDRDAPRDTLAVALGGTLYVPATRPEIAKDLRKQSDHGVVSTVVCLEDSVADHDLETAEQNAIRQLRLFAEERHDGPLVFVRVRAPHQIPMLMDALGEHERVLSGFVIPKFTARSADVYLDAVGKASQQAGRTMLFMPVLESPELAFVENRTRQLLDIKTVLDDVREHVCAVRVGATDLSSAYGLRRGRDLTVWDVRAVADVIADIVNVFGRADGTGYVVTGAVWEHYANEERLFKPLLRQSPFDEHEAEHLRARLLRNDLDGLLREITLDKANGIMGKTVIHPTHIAAVHALSVVTHEEYSDATDILVTQGGGATASSYRNKMNESKPHMAWARRTLQRAAAFGVAHPEISVVDLLGVGLVK